MYINWTMTLFFFIQPKNNDVKGGFIGKKNAGNIQ